MTDELQARRFDRLAKLLAGGIAGTFAGIAYLVTEGIDNKISGRRLYDLQLLGRPFAHSPKTANVIGTAIHMINSFALGALYGLFAEKRLPGPPDARGVTFVAIENTLLYLALAFERFHPARKTDDMGSYWSARSYLWTIPRHVAYGVVLGWLYPRLRNR